MNIQPLSPAPREISVTEPVSSAFERVKQMLFKPFDLGKWVTIGFCAWLAGLGESGGSFNYNGGGGGNHHNATGGGHPAAELRHFFAEARDFFMANAWWVIPVAIMLVLLAVAMWVLVLWLSSQGKFMFLHCVALNQAEVAVPWKKFASQANSLFWFRIVLGLSGMILIFPLFVMGAVTVLRMVLRGEPDVAGVLLAVGLVLVLIGLTTVLAIIQKFMVDIVVPIMFLRGGTCLAAWREFMTLLKEHMGKFALYILFQIVLGIAIGAIILLTVICTCCVAGCLMALPFIGTVVLLPVLVFKRAYPLYYLAQFGLQYNVFLPEPAPPSSPVPPASGAQG